MNIATRVRESVTYDDRHKDREQFGQHGLISRLITLVDKEENEGSAGRSNHFSDENHEVCELCDD